MLCFLFYHSFSLNSNVSNSYKKKKKKKSDVSNGRFNKAQEKKIGGAKFKVCGPMDYEWA